MVKRLKKRSLTSADAFDVINVILLVCITLIILLPLWNIIVISFSSAQSIAEGNCLFWPTEFSLENYRRVFADSSILTAFLVSVGRTVIAVVLHTFFCAMMA